MVICMETTTTHRPTLVRCYEQARLGSVVQYEDISNPPRSFVVVATDGPTFLDKFTLVAAEAGHKITTNGLRAAGWKVIG